MVKKTAQGLLLLTALLMSTGGLEARDLFQNINFDVYGLAGWSTMFDAQYFDSAGRKYHSRFDPDYKFSVGVAIPYNKYLSIESGLTYGPNDLVLTNTNIFPHTVASGSVVMYPVNNYMGTLSAVVHTPYSIKHFKPYVEAGVEYDRFSPTQAAIAQALNTGWASTSTALINHSNKFGFNLGVGLDRKLTRRLTFRIDARDHITSSPQFGLPNSYSAAVYATHTRSSLAVYEVGLMYHLGKK